MKRHESECDLQQWNKLPTHRFRYLAISGERMDFELNNFVIILESYAPQRKQFILILLTTSHVNCYLKEKLLLNVIIIEVVPKVVVTFSYSPKKSPRHVFLEPFFFQPNLPTSFGIF